MGEVQVAMEQLLQALQALYTHSDPATTKQANDWLTSFQQSQVAWSVCDQLLNHGEAPTAARIFAAQTMRSKVQFDFYELPVDSYANLRNSLLSHIDKFGDGTSENLPTHTMLAIAIADLAIQMDDAWPNVVESIFERFGHNPDRYATLLEIVRMLPEENMNYKLMTDTNKRNSSRDRFEKATPEVIRFLLGLQCPTPQAKRKVLECFLSWIKFTNLQAADLAQNSMIPDCFRYVTEGGELSETATDIIIEVLRMCSQDTGFFQPIIQIILSLLSNLRTKFDSLLACGTDAACAAEKDSLLQICRIYVETGECLVPLIMTECTNPGVLQILQVILRCTDLPDREIAAIPLEFWQRLAEEVSRSPETDAKIDQFQGIYVELLRVVLRRCQVPLDEDPFQADDDLTHYRSQLLNLVKDTQEILTPNGALEHVLKSLQDNHRQNIAVQEAHFFCLTKVGERAEVKSDSVLWQLIQSLPPLISQQVAEESMEAAVLNFTKKTAIELLGSLSKWIKTKPDFLRSAMDMISTLLLAQAPAGAPAHIVERMKQVQQAASISFKDICYSGKQLLQEMVGSLLQVYIATMALPIRMHLFIVDGVGVVVTGLDDDSAFREGMEKLVLPLVEGLNSEREKPQVLTEILDRMQAIIRLVNVRDGSSKAVNVGTLISTVFWPMIQQTLQLHAGDPKVVEKSCRLLKHSMRCVPTLFKPNVPAVASTLIQAFQAHQHSSFCYSAEILANTYAQDPEVFPVLAQLFNALSNTGLQCLAAQQSRLEEITELVEDFYGMFERYLRYCPQIVVEAPTLLPTLQLWPVVIFVQQKDAIEAIIAFMEAVLGLVAKASQGGRFCEENKMRVGQAFHPLVLQVCPALVEAIFKLIAGVPTRYVQEVLPCVLDAIRNAYPQEFLSWLEQGLTSLPPSVASQAERRNLGEQIASGDDSRTYDAVQDLCYRCEQVALRTRGKK